MANIWDDYQQMLQSGWSPPPGIEGSRSKGFTTSGNAAWQANQPGMPQPDIPSTPSQPSGGNMGRKPNLMDQMQQLSKQMQRMSGSYLPAAAGPVIRGDQNTPSVAALNRPASEWGTPVGTPNPRSSYTQVYSPQGGSIGMTRAQANRYLAKNQGYSLTPNTPAEQNLSQFNQRSAYAQGYGAPSPTLQGGYINQGGVMNPIENATPQQQTQFNLPQNQFQRFAQTYFPSVASIYSGAQGFGKALGSFFNKNQPQSTQSQNFYAYNPSPVPRQPNRYFDF